MIRKGFFQKSALLATLFALGIGPVAVSYLDAAPPPPNSNKQPKSKVEVQASVGFRLPNGAVSISVGNDRYHYHKGTYYRKGQHGYVVVPAPRGAVIRDLPRSYVRVVISGHVYYRCDGVYYRKDPGGFIVVEAPIVINRPQTVETVVADPYSGYQSVWVGEDELLFKEGQFFRKTSDGLVWVEAPLGAIVSELPDGAVSVWFEEIEYFDSDGVYFRKTPEGYRVVVKPWSEESES